MTMDDLVTHNRCLIILSEKSSGSSALLNRLLRLPQVQGIAWTQHFEGESLYWTKAASILDRPQVKLHRSEVPIPRERARRELIDFLGRNLGGYAPPASDQELVFEGWRALCRRFGPVFCEKSPHHLVQRSALELILECQQRQPDIEFLLIGLVRNPMDTIYSQFIRWGARPERLQHQWQLAYENLLALKERCGEHLIVLRYEDIVASEEKSRASAEVLRRASRARRSDHLSRRLARQVATGPAVRLRARRRRDRAGAALRLPRGRAAQSGAARLAGDPRARLPGACRQERRPADDRAERRGTCRKVENC